MIISIQTMLRNSILLGLFSVTLLLIFPTTGSSETMSVLGEKVSLKTNPDLKSKTLWEYGNGFPFEVLKKQGDWVMVKDFENDSGWIPKSRLQKSRQVIVKVNNAEEKTINIRSNPGTDNSVVGTAFYGVVFSVLEKKGPWLQVRHESGLTGWIKIEFVWGY